MKPVLMPQVNSLRSLDQTRSKSGQQAKISSNKTADHGPNFSDVLKNRLEAQQAKQATEARQPVPLRYSAHAQTRMMSRNIRLSPEIFQKMENAVDKAAGKGIDQTLVLTDDAGFVVSAKNKMIITAVDRNEVAGNIFSNIQGAIVL